MSQYINKSHNRSVLLYHYVFSVKYRRVIFNTRVDEILIQTCKEIAKRYEINVMEIGTDGNYVHFLIQSVPKFALTEIVRIIKSITAIEIYRLYPEVKKILLGGHIWSDGYFVSTVGKYANEKQIENYVKNQGKHYERMYRGQLSFLIRTNKIETSRQASR